MEFTQKKSVLKAALTHAKKVTQATTSKMSTTVNKFKSKKPPIGIIKEKKKTQHLNYRQRINPQKNQKNSTYLNTDLKLQS